MIRKGIVYLFVVMIFMMNQQARAADRRDLRSERALQPSSKSWDICLKRKSSSPTYFYNIAIRKTEVMTVPKGDESHSAYRYLLQASERSPDLTIPGGSSGTYQAVYAYETLQDKSETEVPLSQIKSITVKYNSPVIYELKNGQRAYGIAVSNNFTLLLVVRGFRYVLGIEKEPIWISTILKEGDVIIFR